MRDLIARIRSLFTTGLPMEDLYTISTYERPSHRYPAGRTGYVETVRGEQAAQRRRFELNGTIKTSYYSYIVTKARPAARPSR